MHTYHLGPDEDVQDTIAMGEFENLVEEIVDHRRVENSSSACERYRLLSQMDRLGTRRGYVASVPRDDTQGQTRSFLGLR